jgi:hypothetical protein
MYSFAYFLAYVRFFLFRRQLMPLCPEFSPDVSANYAQYIGTASARVPVLSLSVSYFYLFSFIFHVHASLAAGT